MAFIASIACMMLRIKSTNNPILADTASIGLKKPCCAVNWGVDIQRITKMKAKALILAMAVAATGCTETSGELQGNIRGENAPVRGAFVAKDDGMGNISAIMGMIVHGETFKGQVVAVGGGTSTSYDYAAAFNNGYYGGTQGYQYSPAVVTAYHSTSTFGAMLMGDKGSSMRCELHSSAPGSFESGIGTCTTSNSDLIDIQWHGDVVEPEPTGVTGSDPAITDVNEY